MINDELDLRAAVEEYKNFRLRNFNPENKIIAVENYLKKWTIKDVIVGISGGIDSATVLAILNEISGIRIHAVTIGFDLYRKIFDSSYIHILRNYYSNAEWYYKDLSDSLDIFSRELYLDNQNIANVSYAMRYLAFFSMAQRFNGVTFGTTNRDEMEYVGWFGKNSDMVVDVQPISHLHKFEVRALAEHLGVPRAIIDRTPTGDLVDNTTDEENFGVTYDELSWYSALGRYEKDNEFLMNKFSKVISLHDRNSHKYQGQTFNPVFIS